MTNWVETEIQYHRNSSYYYIHSFQFDSLYPSSIIYCTKRC